MELTVHGKQMDVGEALREHVADKLEEISQKYFNHTTFATVTFSKEGHGHPQTKVHISIQLGKNHMVVADDTGQDPYAVFDSTCEKAAKQLRRQKRKVREDHGREVQTPEGELEKAEKFIEATEGEGEAGKAQDAA